MTRSYLDPSDIFAERGLDRLRLWLTGYDRRGDIFSNPPPQLADLHSALMCAVKELKNRLDPQLEYVVNTAAEQQYGMEFDPEAFWVERVFDLEGVERMRKTGIMALDRGRTMRYLEEARDEIDWTRNEIRRFELHLDNAHKLIAQKLRKKFVYRITPRKPTQYFLVPYVEADTVQVKEDEEMLLDDEHAAERRARSRTPEPGEVSAYDDDFEVGDGELLRGKEEEKENEGWEGGEDERGDDKGEGEATAVEDEDEEMENGKENEGVEEKISRSDEKAKEEKAANEKTSSEGAAGDRKDSVLVTLSWGYLRL